ncbi:MAG: elongation factor P [Paludibacteraceae bacterium]|nr:elongation factor P [Paludibacteraceae bacterium]
MATTADIKNGMCIKFNNGLYTIVEFLHVKPGKGPAFVRTKLKNVETGRTIENTFSSGVKLEVVRIEKRQYQYLYKDDMGYNFMNNETFEQVSIQKDLINGVDFLKEGDTVDVTVHADTENILFAELPIATVLEVTYTEPGLKGDTATNALKPATVETGATVKVPLFINTGDKIKINTADGKYLERAN